MATNFNRLHRYKQSPNLILYYLVIDKHGIIDRFPLKDRKSCPIPSNIADFCMLPNIMEFNQSTPEAKFFTFATISAYGAPLYGACLRIFEVSTENSSSVVYNPKILMIISEHKHFAVFEVFLGYFYLASRKKLDQSALPDIPIENYLVQLENVELPSDEGEGQQLLLRFGRDTLPITIRPRFLPPALNTSFDILFDHISVSNIMLILQNILCEKPVIFISKNISILTPIQDLILSLIHPLKWYHLYLPLTPLNLFRNLLYFNHPFIAGTHTDIFHKHPNQNALIINLDEGCTMHQDEIQQIRCEEFDLLYSLLNNFPKEKWQIYEFQCNVQTTIIALLQAYIRSKESKAGCSRDFAKQIRSSLGARLFIADYRRGHPGDLRLSNLQSFFCSHLKLPRTEKVEPMFEPKIYSKEIRNYEMMYQSHIIPISSKRLEKESKKTNLTRKPYVQLKENEGYKQNQARRQTLCNGATVIASEFCSVPLNQKRPKTTEENGMPLKSWLGRKENSKIAEKINISYQLNGNAIAINSSVESGKWTSSSDSQSIDGREYVKDFEIDTSIQKIETRIKLQNDSSNENELDIFAGLSESDHEHDILTTASNVSQNQTSNRMLHCLEERNEFDAESMRMEFLKQEQSHASIFSALNREMLEELVCPMTTSRGLTLKMLVERARLSAACRCSTAAIPATNIKKE